MKIIPFYIDSGKFTLISMFGSENLWVDTIKGAHGQTGVERTMAAVPEQECPLPYSGALNKQVSCEIGWQKYHHDAIMDQIFLAA